MANSKKILIGPLPPLNIDQLIATLKAHGHDYQVLQDSEKFEEYRNNRLTRSPDLYPTYQGEDTVLLELSLEAVMLIRSDLEKLGVVLKDSDFDPQFDAKEYFCPKCRHEAKAPGKCPRHLIPLLEFSELADYRRLRSERRSKLFAAVMLVFLSACVLFMLYLKLDSWLRWGNF